MKNLLIALSLLFLSACVSTIVGGVVDTAIEVAKVPFKVGAAVVDVVTPDGKDKKEEKERKEGDNNQSDN